MTIGDRIRTLLELVADDGSVIPAGSVGNVVGFEGERVVVIFEDMETDTRRTTVCEIWEVRP